ncbi:MAG: hypothetical protein MUC42_14820 [Bryobacter sp.]|jgi:hypothetical protein|nr:hypothetical protein [Bryobacter sp.]
MGTISTARVFAGGLLAGLIINAGEFLANGLWLGKEWEEVMRAMGKPMTNSPLQMLSFNLWGFAMGIFAVWVYAAIRPRFGPGAKTAVIAGLAAWFPGYFLSMVPPLLMDFFPARLMLAGVSVGLVEVLCGTLAGARVYREETPAG